MKKKILLVGCGGIGFRHLQSLVLLKNYCNIDILEKKNINKSILDLIDSVKNLEIQYLNNISSLKENYDLIIFATTSRVTYKILKDIIKNTSTKKILFEKITFSEPNHYPLVLNLLKKKNIKAWVNCSNRYREYVHFIKKNLKKNEKFFLLCEANNDYFVSNIVHFFDMFNFLSDQNTGNIISSKFENLYKSKRSTYYDCEGFVIASNKKKNVFIYQSQVEKNSDLKILLNLSQKDNLLKIEINDKKIKINNLKKKKIF